MFGLVLAGGRSRRFGREKAAAEVDGAPMLAHAAARLRPTVARLAVNAPAESWAAAWADAHALPRLPDFVGDPDGPLAGIRAGLAWATAGGAELLATVPCDTPRLPADLVARLLAALTPAAGAAVARTAAGLQPLCTLWRCDRLGAVEAALAAGHPPLRAVLARLAAAEASFEDAGAFANVNTPADHAQLTAAPERPDGHQ